MTTPSPPVIFGGRPGKGHLFPLQTPLTRPDDWEDHPVSGTQQSALGYPTTSGPSRTTAAQIPQNCPLPASLWLLLQVYRHSVGWADDVVRSDCHAVDHTVAHFFSSLAHPTDLALGDMWATPLHVAQFLAGLPQFSDLPLFQIDFDSFLNFIAAVGPLPFLPPDRGGTISSSPSVSSHLMSLHPVLRRSSPPSATQQQLSFHFRYLTRTTLSKDVQT